MKKLIFLLALCLSFSCNDSNVTTEKVDTDQVAADLIQLREKTIKDRNTQQQPNSH